MIPNTRERATVHSSKAVNRRVRRQMEESLRRYADHPLAIERRLRELDEEWDIERAIEANASALALTGIVLGSAVDKRWLILPALVTGFLLQHAVQGWCPPVPVLRRLGFRTAYEIDEERQALKALRGDFERLGTRRSKRNGAAGMPSGKRAKAATRAVRAA